MLANQTPMYYEKIGDKFCIYFRALLLSHVRKCFPYQYRTNQQRQANFEDLFLNISNEAKQKIHAQARELNYISQNKMSI